MYIYILVYTYIHIFEDSKLSFHMQWCSLFTKKPKKNQAEIKESSIRLGFKTKGISYAPFETSEGNDNYVKHQKEMFGIQTRNQASGAFLFQLGASGCVSTGSNPPPTQSKSLTRLRREGRPKGISLQQDSICTSKDVQQTSHRITSVCIIYIYIYINRYRVYIFVYWVKIYNILFKNFKMFRKIL